MRAYRMLIILLVLTKIPKALSFFVLHELMEARHHQRTFCLFSPLVLSRPKLMTQPLKTDMKA